MGTGQAGDSPAGHWRAQQSALCSRATQGRGSFVTFVGHSGLGPQSPLSPHPSSQVSPGVIANPFAAGISHRNSLESISSIDRELSPEGPGKVRGTYNRQPEGQGARGRQHLMDPLCSQEKELPGQTLHWSEATEAAVSGVTPPLPSEHWIGVHIAHGVLDSDPQNPLLCLCCLPPMAGGHHGAALASAVSALLPGSGSGAPEAGLPCPGRRAQCWQRAEGQCP
ncbi:hypothetical protein P7K49_026608 [Saguinus oedipus]|uniref:Uncharacterized protein n=1 Tax=Saguinus oedipus TaxID=9490 RepID=A0ABQ9UDP5_SAGOE|nr:hypothetical protein P7K49_026608 [Saguinus oedipus]